MKRLFGKLLSHDTKHDTPRDLAKITRMISLLIQHETFEIFHAQAVNLTEKPIDYFIPAVWAVSKDAQLTPDQQEIGNRVQTLTEKVIRALDVRDLDSSQRFAIGFLVRELIITRLLLFIQMLRGQSLGDSSGQEQAISLCDLDVWGVA